MWYSYTHTKMRNLNLIKRKHETDHNEGHSTKCQDHERQGKAEELLQTKERYEN